METVDMNDSANSNGQETSPSADIPFPDEPRQDDHDAKGGEIPLPPETSDSVKYSPSQVEEGSPSEESSPKKPVLPPDLARKRFLAMSRQKVTLAARSSAPSQSSKKPTSKGVSQYSGRANQTSQPPMLIETIMQEEKKLKERMIQTGSKLVNLPAVIVSTTTPATAIVKPLQMSEPRPLPVEDVPLKKSELAAKESRAADVRSSSSKNYRQRRSSSGSSASPAISRSISPRRRHDRRSRSRDRQDVRRRDRDDPKSRSYRGGRRSPGREKDIRRRSRSPNPKEKPRRRGSRSASPDQKRRDLERHRNDRSPSYEHEKQRKIKVEQDRASDNKRSRKERSPSFVLEKRSSFKSHSPRRSFEHNDVRTAKQTKDRRHRDSSSRDSREKNTSRRDRDRDLELENQKKQIREAEEIRMRKEAEEKELDKTRTSRLPLDWTDYKKFEYTDEHISSLKNRMDPTRTTSSSPSSSRDPSPSEHRQFFSRALIQNPEVIKYVELNTKGKIVAAILKRTQTKMQIEYTVPKNSCAGCYTPRNVVWEKEDPQVVEHMEHLLELPLFSSQVEQKMPKGFRFLKQEQDLCPSDGSRGVNISRLYSDEDSDEPVNHKESTKSEVFKLRKEDSVEGDRASSPQSEEMEEDYVSDSAESVPSPLLKKRYDDEKATATAVENPSVPQSSPLASESPEGRKEEVAVVEKVDEKVKNKSRKEKKKKKAKDKKKQRKRDSSSSSSDDSEESEDETNIVKKRSKRRKKEEKNKKDKKKKRSKKRRQKTQTSESSSSSSSDSESSSTDSSESEKDKKKKSKKKKVKKKSRQQKRDEDSPDEEDQNKGDKSDKGGDAGSTSKRRGDGDQHEDAKGGEKRRRTSDRKHKEDRKKDSSKHRRRSIGINPDGLQFEVSSPALSTSSTGSGSGSDGLNKLHDFEKLEDALTARIEADPSVVAEELLGVKEDISALSPEKFKTDVYDPYVGDTTPPEQLHSNPIPVITRRGSGDALHRNAEAVLQMTQVDNDDVKLLFDNDLEFDADQMLDLLSGGNINGEAKGKDCIDYLTEMWDRFVDGAGTTPGSKSEADSAYISDDEKFRSMIPPVPTTSPGLFSIPEPPGYRLPLATDSPYAPSRLSLPLKSRSPSHSPRPRSPRSRSRSRSISPARRRSRTRYEEDRRYRGRDSEFYDSRYRDRDRDRSYRPRRPYRDDDGYGSSRSRDRDRDRDYYYEDERRFRERTKRENGRYDDRELLDKGRFDYDMNFDKRVTYNVSHQMRSPLGEPPVYHPPAGYVPPQMAYTTSPCCLPSLPPPGFDPTVPPPMYPVMAPSGPLDHQIVSLQPLPEQRLRETTAFEMPFMVGELEGNHRNPSNLREIVPAASFVEGNRSPKRLSLDERLEVEMGIKVTRDDSSNMPLVGGFAGLRNVPQVPAPNPALLQTMQQTSAQPFHQEPTNQLQGLDANPVQEKGPAEHSTAIKRGNLIKVVPMVSIERSFTITKANCKWNPIVVQQTAEQVIRKEGDDVPPKRCVTISVPTVPFEIPLIAPDESSVEEHPEDLIQRLKDERRQARKKKSEIKRKRQLRKKMERRKLIKNIPTDDEELEMETLPSVEYREQTENPSSGPNEGNIEENDTELLKTENIEKISDDKMNTNEFTQNPASAIENGNGADDADETNGGDEEDMDDSSPRPAFEPLSPQKVAVPDPSAEPAKSILAIAGFRRRKEESKGVRFFDGIVPGDGSSRSEGEEEVVSPTPGTKAKTLGKKKERRKKVRSAVEEERRKKLKLLEDAELIENQEPPPPPSAPYPYCPLGILYQFNPPYAVLYAQAVVEHGFELTFTPSIVEPKAVFYDWPTESSAALTEP